MRETLSLMKNIIEGYEQTTPINDLLMEYKQKQNSNIIAFLYVSNYGIIETIAKNYKLLDSQDIASFALQELDKAIKNYDFESDCKFIPFFVTCLKNRLRTEQEALFHNVRFANYCTEDLDILTDYKYNYLFDDFNLDNYNFSNLEKQQAQLLLDGYSVKEIANIFSVSTVTIYKRNKCIGKKMLN